MYFNLILLWFEFLSLLLSVSLKKINSTKVKLTSSAQGLYDFLRVAPDFEKNGIKVSGRNSSCCIFLARGDRKSLQHPGSFVFIFTREGCFLQW